MKRTGYGKNGKINMLQAHKAKKFYTIFEKDIG